jgi:hypothetical protein
MAKYLRFSMITTPIDMNRSADFASTTMPIEQCQWKDIKQAILSAFKTHTKLSGSYYATKEDESENEEWISELALLLLLQCITKALKPFNHMQLRKIEDNYLNAYHFPVFI